LIDDEELASSSRRMREEAKETESRCTELADDRARKKTAIVEKARETRSGTSQRMST
jgi:hypothetical protein